MYEVYEMLLIKFGVTTAEVSKATGIGQSTFSNWKTRRNKISYANAQKLADYFHVSVEYLMTGTDDPVVPESPQPTLNTLAAHFEGEQFTDEEADEIMKFAEFVKSKRKK